MLHQPHRLRPGGQQGLFHLIPDALRRQGGSQMGLLPDGGQGGLLNGKVQPGREAQRPEHPQGVLLKAQLRATHAADAAVLQIRKPAKGVHNQPVGG